MMETSEWLHESVPDALIIFHDRLAHPLWDRRAGALADAVEQRLAGVPVTSVDRSSRLPCLTDALRATRFLGARAPVAVVGDEATARRLSKTHSTLAFAVTTATAWTPDGIVAAFNGVVSEVARRACA